MNKILPLPSVDRIRQIYDFSADTGKFWNRRLKRFGGTQRPSGHYYLMIDGLHYGAHRLAYLVAYGVNPGQMFVDHINHDPSDNRPSNLRLATLAENARNMKGARKDNQTGLRGIRWHKRDKRWYAKVVVNGKEKYVGYFVEKQDAIDAVNSARKLYFGQFSGLG